MSHPLVFEINTRCWLRELSEKTGSRIFLANVPDFEFEKWRELGFTHIWLMGIWTTGPRSRAVAVATSDLKFYANSFPDLKEADVVASPYAIAEYRVAEEFGGDASLKTFRERLKRSGMKLILDFVPNHVGLDHPWLAERPELFVQSANEIPGTFEQETNVGRRWIAHGKDPNLAPWTDTAQLDYRNSETRAAMLKQLLAISEQCDGVRCDMAMLVLNDVFAKTWEQFPFSVESENPKGAWEFWPDAIAKTKQARSDFLFLAEVYWGLEARLQSLGFDFTYDKALYDEIVRRNPIGTQKHLLGNKPEFVAASAHFLENHDEPRIASLLSFEEQRAAAFLIFCVTGMRLLHHGQLTGARLKTPVQFGRTFPEATDAAIQKMYEQLLGAIRNSEVGQGGFELLKPVEAWAGNPTAQNFILIQWCMELDADEFILAAVNLASHPSQCYAPLVLESSGESDWEIAEILGEDFRKIAGRELDARGLFLDLPEHGAKLLKFSRLNP
jgi:hypothetical protein